jgi:hypothetical protein
MVRVDEASEKHVTLSGRFQYRSQNGGGQKACKKVVPTFWHNCHRLSGGFRQQRRQPTLRPSPVILRVAFSAILRRMRA